MTRTTVAAAVTVGIAAALLVTGCAQGPKPLKVVQGNKGGPKTHVYLTKNASGYCAAAYGVGMLGGNLKNDKITWYVSNNCGTLEYVAVTHYQEEIDGVPSGSVLTDVVYLDPATDSYKDTDQDKKLDAKIVKANSSGTDKLYKYWICVSPNPIPNPLPNVLPSTIQCLDPDIDVWP
jgi:hypothetical protein